jgi:hypothetical protein
VQTHHLALAARSAATAILVACFVGCQGLDSPANDFEERPREGGSAPTEIPQIPSLSTPTVPPAEGTPAPAATPKPTSTPVPARGQWTRGSASVRIRGIDRLPLRRTQDYIVAASFTWELSGSDHNVPLAELSIRGTSSQPCQQRPCGAAAGLVVRVTANAAYDSIDDSSLCGSGVNYHNRLALGRLGSGGSVDVQLEWDESGLRVSTPVDSVALGASRSGVFGFGRFLVGAPFGHGERGFGWDSLSIDNFGGTTELLSFGGREGERRRCP